jgi:hypothetical protein
MCMQTREFSTQEHAQNNIQLEARGQLGGKNAVPFLMVGVPPPSHKVGKLACFEMDLPEPAGVSYMTDGEACCCKRTWAQWTLGFDRCGVITPFLPM